MSNTPTQFSPPNSVFSNIGLNRQASRVNKVLLRHPDVRLHGIHNQSRAAKSTNCLSNSKTSTCTALSNDSQI
eukprot:766803-Amphidinium_carterae.1